MAITKRFLALNIAVYTDSELTTNDLDTTIEPHRNNNFLANKSRDLIIFVFFEVYEKDLVYRYGRSDGRYLFKTC